MAGPASFYGVFSFTSHRFNAPNGRGVLHQSEAVDRYLSHLDVLCQGIGGCLLQKFPKDTSGQKSYQDHAELFLPDKEFSFVLSSRPGEVIVRTSSMDVPQIQNNIASLQALIFDLANLVGMNPARRIPYTLQLDGDATFGASSIDLYRFIADFANHPELLMGVLGDNEGKRTQIVNASKSVKRSFVRIGNDVRKNKIFDPVGVAKQIETSVFRGIEDPVVSFAEVIPRENRVGRVIIHEVRTPTRAQDFYLQAHLIDERIQFLRRQRVQVRFHDAAHVNFSRQQIATRFAVYLAEMGARWETFAPIVSEFVRETRLAGFVRGPIDWSDKSFTRTLPYYIELLATSEWARERFKEILYAPGSQGTNKGTKLLAQMAERAELSDGISDFVFDISQSRKWRRTLENFTRRNANRKTLSGQNCRSIANVVNQYE